MFVFRDDINSRNFVLQRSGEEKNVLLRVMGGFHCVSTAEEQ